MEHKQRSVTVHMKSGKSHVIYLHVDETFKELVNEIIYSDSFYIAGDIVFKVSEIETIVGD